MTHYSFQMLGPFLVEDHGQPIELPRSKKARAVLAYLAAKNREQRKDHLTDVFFAETRDPKGGLRWAISRLRASLDKEFIATGSETICLDATRLNSDTEVVEGLDTSTSTINDIVELENVISGDFLADLSLPKIAEFEAWRLSKQVDYSNHHAVLLRSLINRSLGQQSGVDFARKLVNLDITRESAWALLIKALLALNQLPEARRIQRLAVAQLERDSVRLTGKLESVWQFQGVGNQESLQRLADAGHNKIGLRPRLAILNCHPTRADRQEIARNLTDVFFRCCSVSKSTTVLSPTVSEQLGDNNTNVLIAARSQDIDLLLESRLGQRGARTVIEVDLVDVDSGASIFGWQLPFETFDALQIAERLEAYLSARMEIDIPIALLHDKREKPSRERTARDEYLLALPRIFSAVGFDPVGAYELLESALSRQPYFGQASCVLSLIRMFIPQCNNNDEQLDITLSLARRSVEICQDDAFVLGIAAITIGHITRDTDTALDLTRRALSINPHSIMGGIANAMVNHYHGDDDACLQRIDSVEEKSDTEPVSFFCHTLRAMAHYQKGDYENAINWSRKAVGHNPKFIIALRYLLASLGQIAATAEARNLVEKIIAIDRSENIAYFKRRSAYASDSRTDHLCDGLRKAGLPEST